MSAARDLILNTRDDFKTETVDVPEWGLKLVMRELTVADRGRLVMNDLERVEVAGGWDFLPKHDPIAPARVVVASAHDEDGQRVFQDGDEEALASRASSVVDRLAKIARRLSGLGAEDEPGKEPASESSETPADSD